MEFWQLGTSLVVAVWFQDALLLVLVVTRRLTCLEGCWCSWGGTGGSAACAPSGTECLGSLGSQGTCGREAGARNVLCCLYLTPFCSLHLDWYKITSAVATRVVPKGALVQQQSQGSACSWSCSRWSAGQQGGPCWSQVVVCMFWKNILVLAEALCLKVGNCYVRTLNNNWNATRARGLEREKYTGLTTFSVCHGTGCFHVKGNKENSYFLPMWETFQVCNLSA